MITEIHHFYRAKRKGSPIHVHALFKRAGKMLFMVAEDATLVRNSEITLISEIRYTQYYFIAKKKAKERLNGVTAADLLPKAQSLAEAKLQGEFSQRRGFRSYVLKSKGRIASRVKVFPNGEWYIKIIFCHNCGAQFPVPPLKLKNTIGMSLPCPKCDRSLI